MKYEKCGIDSSNAAVCYTTILLLSADKPPHFLKLNLPPTQARGCPGLSLLRSSLNSF